MTGRGGTIDLSGSPLLNGQTLWLRWVELNDPGNDHGLAIDNMSATFNPVPEPVTCLAVTVAGLVVVGQMRRRLSARC